MATSYPLTTNQLREALELSEQIDTLQRKLSSLLVGTTSAPTVSPKANKSVGRPAGKRNLSTEGRARIAAAAKARWAKLRGKAAPAKAPAKAAAKVVPKKKGGLTPEGRAKLAAAMKARWAARKKGAPAPNASAS